MFNINLICIADTKQLYQTYMDNQRDLFWQFEKLCCNFPDFRYIRLSAPKHSRCLVFHSWVESNVVPILEAGGLLLINEVVAGCPKNVIFFFNYRFEWNWWIYLQKEERFDEYLGRQCSVPSLLSKCSTVASCPKPKEFRNKDEKKAGVYIVNQFWKPSNAWVVKAS